MVSRTGSIGGLAGSASARSGQRCRTVIASGLNQPGDRRTALPSAGSAQAAASPRSVPASIQHQRSRNTSLSQRRMVADGISSVFCGRSRTVRPQAASRTACSPRSADERKRPQRPLSGHCFASHMVGATGSAHAAAGARSAQQPGRTLPAVRGSTSFDQTGANLRRQRPGRAVRDRPARPSYAARHG